MFQHNLCADGNKDNAAEKFGAATDAIAKPVAEN
jgi:hypothetical protein